METIVNVASADAYTDANTLIQPGSGTLEMLVANAAIIVRLNFPTDIPGKYQWSPELFLGPSVSARTFQDVGGVQFRSALAGSSAQVSATLYTQDEALSVSTSAFTSTVAPSGGVSPPPPTTGTLNFDYNGAAVGTEATLDVVDAAAVGNPTASPITWVATDTPGSKVAYVPVFKLGVQHNDASQVNEAVLDLQDQATFPALTWALTDDASGHRVKVKPTISGVATVLADSGVLGAPAASITFSGIPATYSTLVIEWLARGDTAATTVAMQAQMNADTGAHYSDEVDRITGGVITNVLNETAVTAMGIALIPAATAGGANAGGGSLTIAGYAGTTFANKPCFSDFYLTTGTGAAAQLRGWGGGIWFPAAATAITSVKLLLAGAANFVAGTRAVLYGL